MARATQHDDVQNSFSVNEQGVITVVCRGSQTAATVRTIMTSVEELAMEVRDRHQKVYVLVDFSTLTDADATPAARLESRKLFSIKGIDAWALVGPSSLLTIAMYIVKMARPSLRVHYFNTPAQAAGWLDKLRHPQSQSSRISLIAGIVIGLIGLLGLLGWAIDSRVMTSVLPQLRPINPVAALALVAMGYSYIAYWLRKPRHTRAVAFIGITLGVLALLPIPIDQWLFADKMRAIGMHTELADSAAVCFIALSVATLFQGTKKRWQEVVQYSLSGLVILVALFNVFGLLYARDVVYGISPTFVMAFNLALAFFIGGLTFIILIILKRSENMLRSVSGTGWLIIMALLFVQVATYAAWAQSSDRIKEQSQQMFDSHTENVTNAVNARVQTYVDTLRGFHGLFAASDEVTPTDFTTYYNSLELKENYPGLRSMAFVSAVKEADLPAFVAQQRQHNPSFAVRSKTNEPLHFIATQVAGSTSSAALGLDIGSIPGRSAIYNNALASGHPYASGTVTFAATATTPAEDGFFITIPVRSAQSNEPIGLVNANFNYANFFPSLFEQNNLLNGIGVEVRDSQNDHAVYQVAHPGSDTALTQNVTVPVENQSWKLQVQASSTFGVSDAQRRIPVAVLVAGQLFALLLIYIFIMQSRARRQALDLADAVTEDLQIERNAAVARSKKNDAILSGIGDGVFALDMKGRISLFNPAAEQITGFSAQEVIGKPYGDVLTFQHEKTRRSYSAFITGALAGKHMSMPRGIVLINKDNRAVPVADSASPFYDGRHRQQGVIVVFRDATQERAFERTKDEFVSLASHQLRTPLSAINWYVEMLLAGDAGKLTGEQQEYLNEVAVGNRRMVDLINSLLNVSRLDLGKLTNVPETVVVHEVIDSLETELRGDIGKKNQQLVKEVESSITTMQLDPKLFRMILQNLLSNAVKYTPEKGTLTLAAHFATKHGAKNLHGDHVLFSVTDTGYGIPAAQQPNIFGKMYRAENVQKLGIEGTGLGLYIVKSAAEKMSGRVWFESMESVGTTFYVLLPIDARGQKHKAADAV